MEKSINRSKEDYLQAQVLEGTYQMLKACLVYFAVIGSYLVWVAPPAVRVPLAMQKFSCLLIILALGKRVRQGLVLSRHAYRLASLLLALCITSSLFSAWAQVGMHVSSYTAVMCVSVAIVFLHFKRALLAWAIIWATWIVSYQIRGDFHSTDLVTVFGFQIIAVTCLLIRRHDCISRYQSQQEIAQQSAELSKALQLAEESKQHLDQLVDKRTAELRLAYEELSLSAAQRQEMQQASEKLHEQLLQAQKMESLGRLAGGVAHDFNNLLTVILGNLELAKFIVGEEQSEYLSQAEIAAKRAAEVSSQLLAFSRRQVLRFDNHLNLSQLVENTAKMIERLVGEDVHLSVKSDAQRFVVRGDSTQLQQVVMNLAVNARDAMPSGGHLSINLSQTTRKEQPVVCLEVCDTGAGISAEVLPHIFEPFYTTKPFGQGTGLGLSTVDGIVSQHQGEIDVITSPEGTTFRIYFPLSNQAAGESGSRSIRRPALGHARLLLVEDDAQVRGLALKILKNTGYRVEVAENGEKALEIVNGAQEPFDLLVTDVVMPGMDGATLANRIHSLLPQAKVLFVSGYTDDRLAHFGIEPNDCNFLPKPYSPLNLCRKVQAILASESQEAT